MSDYDGSPAETPTTHAERVKKRRQGRYTSGSSTPRDSSPDELAIHDQPKSSRLNSAINTPAADSSPPRDSYNVNSPYSRSPSPDELARAYPYEDDHPLRTSSSQSSRTPSEQIDANLPEVSDYAPDMAITPPASHGVPGLCYEPILSFQAHERGIGQVKFSPDGRWLASCSADARIKIWDSITGELINTLSGHMAGISAICWSPDSTTLASGSDDKMIRLWDRSSGLPHRSVFSGHHNYVVSLAFSPKGNMLVSGSFDEAVFLWDLRSGSILRSLPAHSDPVYGVCFSWDGTLVASCATDGLIRVWDTATGQCLRTLVHEDNAPVVAVQFAENGRYLIAWTLDSCIRLWDFILMRPTKTYQGHKNEKHSICGASGTYGTDVGLESFVVSGSEDGSLLFWDIESKVVLQKVEAAHEAAIMGVDKHPTRQIIATCSADGVIKLWKEKSEKAVSNGHVSNGVNGGTEVEIKYESPLKMELDEEASRNGGLDVNMTE